jgi:CheY-like chemotaxis protein
MSVANDASVDIRVVEDNDGERASIVEWLQASMHDVGVVAAIDGTEALDSLFSRGAWKDRAGADPPRLILLDVRLMGSDGFSALGQIRPLDAEEALTLMAIVILADSQVAGGITKS